MSFSRVSEHPSIGELGARGSLYGSHGVFGVECDLCVAYAAPNAGKVVARHRRASEILSIPTNGEETCQLNSSAFPFLRPRPREETSIHQEIFDFLGKGPKSSLP